MQKTFIFNAPTCLDEGGDPGWDDIDVETLGRFPNQAFLTYGDQSAEYFPPIVRKLGAVLHGEVHRIEGVGHVPHVTRPDLYIETVTTLLAHANRDGCRRQAAPEDDRQRSQRKRAR